MNIMSKWSDIYKSQISRFSSLDTFIKFKIGYKKKLINVIKKYGSNNKRILEVGCGSGTTSVFLSIIGYEVIGIDSDPDMVNLAMTIAREKKSSATFHVDHIQELATTAGRFGVIFSNGVMEHFSDKEIVNIVDKHLSVSDYVAISVPSDYFSEDQKIYGNERFMSKNTWKDILSNTTGSLVEEFSFDSDKPNKNKPQFIGFVLSSR